jgi:periplasmic copper chaperone A
VTADSQPPRAGTARSWLAELARAAAGPVICAVVLIGLLFAWVVGGGDGTLTRVQLQVTAAAVPIRAFTAQKAATIHTAETYLTIKNLTGTADELIAVRSPDAESTTFIVRTSVGGKQTSVSGFTVPAHGTLTLGPYGDDVLLQNPRPYESSQDVPLTLVFRDAGQITIDAPVTQ